MIVRILGGEGQFDISEADLEQLNSFDDALERALETGDEESFRASLHDLIEMVRRDGKPLPPESLVDSPFILPHPDSSLAEVRELLSESDGGGVIPDPDPS